MMAEDKVSSKLEVMFSLDENINTLHTSNLLSCSSQREDNQNILITNSHAVSIISNSKCSEFNELSSNISNNAYKTFDQVETISSVQKTVSYQNSNSMSSTLMNVSKVNMVDSSASHNDFNVNPTNPLLSDDFHQPNDIGKDHQSAEFTECSKAELLHDSTKTHNFSKSEKLKQTVNSSGLLENHSEAGPDVAEFSEEELRSVAELFKEPSAFDFFQKASNSKLLRESPVGRLSQFIKLESTYKAEGGQDSGLDISGDSNSLNVACGNERDYEFCQLNSTMTTDSTAFLSEGPVSANKSSASPKKMDKTSSSHQQNSHCGQEQKLFTEEEFTQALKMQELLFHEKQLKRDKEKIDQIKVLERDKQVLKNQVIALSKGYRASRSILEELLNIFTLWLTAKEQERVETTSNNQKILKERDQALEDLQNVESAFADLHRRYENCKAVLEGYKQNEDRMKHQVAEVQLKLKQQEQMYEMLRSRIQDKLDSANAEIENARKSGDAEVTVLRAQLKKAEMKVSSLEKDLEQKNKENIELGSICDDLIAKVGKT